MKVFKLSLIIGILFIAFQGTIEAQEATKPFIGRTWLKPPSASNTNKKSFALPGGITNPDTSFTQLKALVGVAYSYPDNKALGLVGLSYQHVKYKYQTSESPDESYVDWAINLVYGGGETTTAPIKDVDFSSFGIGASFLNKTLGVYILASRYANIPTDPTVPAPKKELKPVFAISYSF